MATGKLPYSESLPYAGTLTATKPVTEQSIVNTVPTSQAATTVDYMQPIPRLFDVDKYLDGMAASGKQTKKEKKYLSALGYALQLGNPNFDPTAYLRNYEQEQAALNEAELNRLTAADRMRVSREVLRRSKALDIETPEQFGEALTNWGVLGLDLRKNLIDDFKQFAPTKPESSILTSKEFTVDSLKRYAETGNPTDLQYISGRREQKAFDRIQKIATLTNTERDQLEGFIKVPLAKIRETQEAYQKVKAVAISDRISKEDMAAAQAMAEGTELSGQGIRDIARINAYQRLIDPATVREGDVALARSATSWAGWLNILKDRIAEGAFLDDTMRETMDIVARRFYLAQVGSFFPDILDAKENISTRYTERYGFDQKDADLDFESVVGKRNMKDWKLLYQEFLDEDDEGAIYVPEDDEDDVSNSLVLPMG